MKLAELQIDQFGVWRHLTLPLNESGLNVLYGPNGTGKSTLLEFVRGVLFGYSAESLKKLPESSTAAGSLWLSTGTDLLSVTRKADSASAVDTVEVEGGAGGSSQGNQRLQALLAGVSPELWDGVFCVGLNEIQELGALTGDRVAEQIYEASLGWEGRRILGALHQSQADRTDAGRRGRLESRIETLSRERARLVERLAEVEARQRPECHSEREQLLARVTELEIEVTALRRRQRSHELQSQLWKPLHRVRECRQELERHAHVAQFPVQGLARLQELDAKVQRLTIRARRQKSRLKKSARFEPRSGLSHDEAAALRGFVAQREWFAEVARQRSAATQRFADHSAKLDGLRQTHAADWSDEALRALSHTPEAGAALAQAGTNLRLARLRYSRLKRMLHRAESRLEELREAVEDGRQGLPSESIDDALDSARSRLDVVPQAAVLKARESLLRDRLKELGQQPRAPVTEVPLPGWLSMAVALFFFLGIIIAGWGFVAGVTTSALAGLIYVFMGLTFGGIAWGLKSQYETDRVDQAGQEVQQRSTVERDLQAVRRELQSIKVELPVAANDASTTARAAAAEVSRLSDLAHLERELHHLEQRSKRLQQHARGARAGLVAARNAWLEKLERLGLAKTYDVDQVVQGWSGLGLVAQQLATRDEVAARCDTLEQLWRAVETDVADLALRTPGPQPTAIQVLSQLDDWKQLLAVWQQDQLEGREMRRQAAQSRQKLRRLSRRIRTLSAARKTLWRQAGATDRSEFASLAAAAAERVAAQQRLEQAEAQLQLVTADSPELAALASNLGEVLEPISPLEQEQVARELRDREQELSLAHDQLAELDLEIEHLLGDATAADLRLDLQCLDQQRQAAVQSLAALSLAGEVVDAQARAIERRSQPATLAAASTYLDRITCHRYVRIWTPLAERRLMVEDHNGDSHTVESLSRGARDQLYLAVRLAVIDRLSAAGVELPLLLDDVFVNYDQPRTEAAIDLLAEFGRRGRQVLFVTCHQHLLEMFRERSVEPIWLPSLTDPHRVDRRAG